MPYATIDEILRQVPADNPGSPTGFPDFDPEDTKAWAYFVYVYLDASQSDGYGRPCFLPRYGRKAGSGESVWYENVIEWEGGAANPFKDKFAPDYDKMHRIGMIKLIFNYINNLVREWHYGYDGKSDRKMGFYIKNRSREIYNEYLRRVDKARDVAWRKVMQYSGEMLYSYSREHVDSGTRQYKVQAENGEALILPALVLLFAKVNREWNEVFSQDLKITSGYRTFSQQQNLYKKLKKEEEETGRKRYVALHSAHVCGAAIDVVPSPGLCGHYGDWGLNMFLGYIAWLFRRVARREANSRDGRTFIDVKYAGNVTRQREEYNPRWEWAGKKLLSPVPYTIMESTNRTLHVSYIWLLRAEENRKEELPSFVRPYSGDIANPEGHEAKGPRAFDPYLNAFNVGTYKNDICQGKTTLGITARWMKGFIRYDYPSQEEIDEIHVEIKNIDRELEQGSDRRLINELKERKIQLERFVSPLEERRNELLKVFDRDRALRALDNQINWGE